MNFKCAFSSDRVDWCTPLPLFNKLSEIAGGFDIDFYASDDNHLCDRYFTKDRPWRDCYDDFCKVFPDDHVIPKIFMNPPYKNFISTALETADYLCANGALVCCLIPARTDTKWFHRYIYNKPGVLYDFLPRRIKFVGASSFAPFPSMVVWFLPFHGFMDVDIRRDCYDGVI